MRYWEIFWSFFRVGTFTIGGGYAMIPVIQHELVVRHKWIGDEEFLNYVAIAQAMPGVFAVNMAALTGYRLRRGWGSAVAITGNILMPIIFILLLAIFFRAFRDNPVVQRLFLGIRPAVVALIAAPVFTLWRNEKNKNEKQNSAQEHSLSKFNFIFRASFYIIPPLSAILIWLLGVNPIFIVLGAALLGYLYSKLKVDAFIHR